MWQTVAWISVILCFMGGVTSWSKKWKFDPRKYFELERTVETDSEMMGARSESPPVPGVCGETPAGTAADGCVFRIQRGRFGALVPQMSAQDWSVRRYDIALEPNGPRQRLRCTYTCVNISPKVIHIGRDIFPGVSSLFITRVGIRSRKTSGRKVTGVKIYFARRCGKYEFASKWLSS